jgi:gamma-tubulin complex component 3
MATFNRERVEHALNELLVRIVPEDANDSEEAANERFDEAFDFAIETLSAAGGPSVVPDVDHIADLISSRSMRRVDHQAHEQANVLQSPATMTCKQAPASTTSSRA